jgi:hypothetical protein
MMRRVVRFVAVLQASDRSFSADEELFFGTGLESVRKAGVKFGC